MHAQVYNLTAERPTYKAEKLGGSLANYLFEDHQVGNRTKPFATSTLHLVQDISMLRIDESALSEGPIVSPIKKGREISSNVQEALNWIVSQCFSGLFETPLNGKSCSTSAGAPPAADAGVLQRPGRFPGAKP